MYQNPLKNGFSKRNILILICVGLVWIAISYFLLEKQAFNGLLQVFVYKHCYHMYVNMLFLDFKKSFEYLFLNRNIGKIKNLNLSNKPL